MYKDYLQHFNPNHDPNTGQFAPKYGGGSSYYRENLNKASKGVGVLKTTTEETLKAVKGLTDLKSKKLNVDISTLSDRDLREIVSRKTLEKKYTELMLADKKSASDRLEKAIQITGAVSAASLTTIGLLKIVDDWRNRRI